MKPIRLLALLIGLLVAFAFQNCLQLSEGYQSQKSSAPAFSGGQGYDGKTYAIHAPDKCADEDKVEARFEIRSGQAILTRDNCVDVAPAAQIPREVQLSPTAITFGTKKFDLESVPATMPGVPTPGSALGDYAPSIFRQPLSSTGAIGVQAAPLGSDRILAVHATGRAHIKIDTLVFRVFKRVGIALTRESETIHTVNFEHFGDALYEDTEPLVNFAPWDDNSAVLFVQAPGDQNEWGMRSLLVKASETGVSIADNNGAAAFIPANNIAGHPIDASRFLIWYIGDTGLLSFRVLKRTGDSLSLGPELTGSGAPFDRVRTEPAILPGATAGTYRVIFGNYSFMPSTLSTITLTVTDDALVWDGVVTALDSVEKSMGPFAVGNNALGIVAYEADDPARGTHYQWGTLINGTFTKGGYFKAGSNGSDRWAGMATMTESTNMTVGNQAFFRLPWYGNLLVSYFDSSFTGPRQYNLAERVSEGQGTGRIFASGNALVVITYVYGQGSSTLLVLSTPGAP